MRGVLSLVLVLALTAGCASGSGSSDRDCALWGPAESDGPVGDAAKGGAQGAVIGVVTGSVARGVVLGAARNVSACIGQYSYP
jgi:hypothetical protein